MYIKIVNCGDELWVSGVCSGTSKTFLILTRCFHYLWRPYWNNHHGVFLTVLYDFVFFCAQFTIKSIAFNCDWMVKKLLISDNSLLMFNAKWKSMHFSMGYKYNWVTQQTHLKTNLRATIQHWNTWGHWLGQLSSCLVIQHFGMTYHH